jgi:hypothetical protein
LSSLSKALFLAYNLGSLIFLINISILQAKERAVRAGDRLGERIGIKVLREDYPVEVLAVPISLRVEKGR